MVKQRKRFLDSALLSSGFFLKLNPEERLFWVMLQLKCDTIGQFEMEGELLFAERMHGLNIDPVEFANKVNDTTERLRELSSGRWFLTNFIREQYGRLNPNSPPHKRYIKDLNESGLFSKRRETGLIKHSGLVQFDIDYKDNPVNMEDLKDKIKLIPYVAYCGLSVSGLGLWGLIPIEQTDQHKGHFRAIQKAFSNAGVVIDPAPSNVASFRFISYDPNPYINKDAQIFTYTLEENNVRTTRRDNHQKVEELINKIQLNHTDITNGYENWLKVGFAISDEFGESGRTYFHQVSQWHDEYDYTETDLQFSNCLSSNRAGITIASLFHLCKLHGVMLNEGKAQYEHQKDSVLQGNYRDELTVNSLQSNIRKELTVNSLQSNIRKELTVNSSQSNIRKVIRGDQENTPFGFNPYTGEVFDKRGYPAEWDSITLN